jgi:hypothetical protein
VVYPFFAFGNGTGGWDEREDVAAVGCCTIGLRDRLGSCRVLVESQGDDPVDDDASGNAADTRCIHKHGRHQDSNDDSGSAGDCATTCR